MADIGELYHQDFFRWTEEQAAALRRAKGSNLSLDWENLAEEIEGLGRSERRELSSQIRRILLPLYKLDASPAGRPRGGWRASIEAARADIAELLEESPSLRREVDGLIAKQARIAAKLAATDLARHREAADAVWAGLEKSGFTAEQVIGDWFPG